MFSAEEDDVAVLNIETLVARAVKIHTHTRILAMARALRRTHADMFSDVDRGICVMDGVCA